MKDALILALTLYAEAAGEPIENKMAVASVIYNRAHGEPSKMAAVCTAPRQFSCWNNGTPKRPSKVDRAWAECLGIASAMLSGNLRPTTTATHYHDTSIQPPRWANGMKLVMAEARLRFYAEA
jgi:N-acetylmuramoyl-L-alanine amidase